MSKFYQNNKNKSFLWLVVFLSGLFTNNIFAQTTITTESGTNYNGLSGVLVTTPAAACAVTFVVENTSANPITLTQVHSHCKTGQNGTRQKLWYSSTSLSGAPTIAAPAWTLIATGNVLSVPADAYYPVVTGLSFTIPAGAQYRFALESSNGISYTNQASLPAPSIFTSGGVNLKVFDADVNGEAVGYGGGFPSPLNFPRAFTGRIVYTCANSTPATAPTITPDTGICAGTSATLRVISGTLNAAAGWKWYTSSCGGVPVGTGDTLTVAPVANTTYFARGEGGCASAPGPCAAVVVAVRPNPGTPTINAVAPICLGSLQALTINPVAITPGSVTVNSSPTLSLNIPDNTVNGANTALTVAGVPAGATITGIDVTLNITHTYVSDLIINLKAPNNQILALDKYLTATGNEGENFVNTVISSAGTTALSDGSAPFTATFKPDAINTAIGTAPVQNPAGFVSNAASFANLYSVPNGTWTLALADGGPADLGTITGWTITINYTTSATAYPAVWTPGSTLFTDAAGTIAYDGVTPRFQVFAKPAVTTTYSAVSILNGCQSAGAASATLTVNNPASFVAGTLPAFAEICQLGSATFVVAANGTTPAFQWESDNGTGTTFTAINNNANYSGVTNDTLVVSNTPYSWNGYQYRCKVTSLAPCTATAYSDTVSLVINKTPVATLTAAPYTRLLPGLTTTLTAVLDSAAASYDWFKNGVALDDVTTSSLDATVNDQGTYTVLITDQNGCSATSNAVVISDSVSSRLFIYPNPTAGNFVVSYYSLNGNTLPRTLMIYDSKGALVMNRTYTINKSYGNMEVDFSKLNSGVYMVNLLDMNGKRLAYGKVVVQ